MHQKDSKNFKEHQLQTKTFCMQKFSFQKSAKFKYLMLFKTKIAVYKKVSVEYI